MLEGHKKATIQNQTSMGSLGYFYHNWRGDYKGKYEQTKGDSRDQAYVVYNQGINQELSH